MITSVGQPDIRIFDRTEFRVDGVPVTMPRQQETALDVLVAARRPVTAQTLIDQIWPTADNPGSTNNLFTVMSRLRTQLERGGLDVSNLRDSRGYELVANPPNVLADVVDAYRFGAAAQRLQQCLVEGQFDAAWSFFDLAAREWIGEPFADVNLANPGPSPVADFRRTLMTHRADLVRRIATHALIHGRFDAGPQMAGRPITAGLLDTDAMWLLRLLDLLDRDGISAADDKAETCPRPASSDLSGRAFDLIRLRESGVEIGAHRPYAATPVIGGGDQLAREHGFAAFLGLLADGQPAALELHRPAGTDALLRHLAHRSQAVGVRVIRVACRDLDDLYPWRIVAGVLWAEARRDLSTAEPPPTYRVAINEFILARVDHGVVPTDHGRTLAQLVALLEWLLRPSVRDGLILVVDDAHLLRPVARQVLADLRARLAAYPFGVVLASRDGGHGDGLGDAGGIRPAATIDDHPDPVAGPAPAPIEHAGLPWLAAAAITSTGLDIDAPLVAEMLDLDAAAGDLALAAAVMIGAVTLAEAPKFADHGWRDRILTHLTTEHELARRLHYRAFEILDAASRNSRIFDPALPVRIARHGRASRPLIPNDRLALAYLAAAQAEQRAYSADAAIVWSELALPLAIAPATRVNLLVTVGDANNDNGDMAAAVHAYLRAHEAAGGDAILQAAAAIRLGRQWTDPGQADDELLFLLRATEQRLATTPNDEAAALRLCVNAHIAHKTAMAVSAIALSGIADAPQGPDLARRTLAHLRDDHDAAVRCEVLNECRWGLYDHVPPAELLIVSQQLHQASLATGSAYFRSEALIALAIDQARLGQMRAVTLTAKQHARHVARHPRPMGEWLQNALATMINLWHGRFTAVETWLYGDALHTVDKLHTSHAVPAGTLSQTWDGQCYWLLRELGRTAELFAGGPAGRMEGNAYFPIWPAGQILALCDVGDFGTATDHLTAFLTEQDNLATFPPHGWAVPTMALLAEAASLLHAAGAGGPDIDRLIPELRRRLSQHPDEVALAGWPTALLGPVARFTGILALAEGDVRAAINDLRHAKALVNTSPPLLARVHCDLATALLRASKPADHAQAAELLGRSLATAETLLMIPLASRCRDLLATI